MTNFRFLAYFRFLTLLSTQEMLQETSPDGLNILLSHLTVKASMEQCDLGIMVLLQHLCFPDGHIGLSH